MKRIRTFEDFNCILNENNIEDINIFKKILNKYENDISFLHQKGRFQQEAETYFNLFKELRSKINKNEYTNLSNDVEKMLNLSNKLRNFSKVDFEFTNIYNALVRGYENVKTEILKMKPTTNEVKPITTSEVKPSVNKEMSQGHANLTKEEAKEIINEIERLIDKYPDNTKLTDLQNNWYSTEFKDKDYDFWWDTMQEIFKK